MTLGSDTKFTRRRKEQGDVALSTAEAEYVAQCEIARDTAGCRNTMEYVRYAQECTKALSQDNTAAIVWAEEGPLSGRAKTIDVKVHFTNEEIQKGLLKLQYASTTCMIADIMANLLVVPQWIRQSARRG